MSRTPALRSRTIPPKTWLVAWVILLTACTQVLPVIAPKPPTQTPSPSGSASPTESEPGVTATLTLMPGPTAAPTSAINLTDQAVRGQIIRFWHPWNGAIGAALQALVDEFNLTNPYQIIVAPVYQGPLDELSARLSPALETNDAPNLVVGYLHQAIAWDANRAVVDWNTYVNDVRWGMKAPEQADFYPVFWQQDTYRGKRLGLPAQRSGMVLYYNQTWARQLGFLAAPQTEQQLKAQACMAARVTRQEGNPETALLGGWIISPHYTVALGWIEAFGGAITLPPNSAQVVGAYQLGSGEVEKAFTFMRELYDSNCAWLPENQYPEAEFAGRLGLFAAGSVMSIPYQAEVFQQAGNTDEWTVIPFPSPVSQPAMPVYGPSFVMLVSTPERQLASWLFIQWLLSASSQARLVEASGALPLRAAAFDALGPYQARYPQWLAAALALPYARVEPAYPSWEAVRWALGDANTQLFRSYFTIDQTPTLVQFLSQTALDLQRELDGLKPPAAAPTETILDPAP